MDNIRWEDMFTNLQIWRPGTVRTSAELKNYLSNRILFLDSIWIDDEKYCTVQLESPLIYAYWNISVKQGTYLKTDYMDITEVTWYDAATGQPVDLCQPILTDMTLTQMQITNTVSASYVPSTKDYVIIFSIAVLLSIMLLFITIDTMQRRKEKSCADERNQTNISPRI